MARRCKDTGQPMLVTLPKDGYEDTGEGGLAFFLVVKQREDNQLKHLRQTCIAGDMVFPQQNCLIKPNWLEGGQLIDAGLLIGSTGQSLWSDKHERYFVPRVSDLTPEGKRLYHTVKRLYGEVTIVTLLDT